MAPTPTTPWLVKQLEKQSHWKQILDAFNVKWTYPPHNQTGSCTRLAANLVANDSSPYYCTARHLSKVKGVDNVFLSPVIGNGKLHSLHEFHGMHRCIEQMSKHERKKVAKGGRDGRQYLRVVFSRLEYQWASSHPPLSLLDSSFAWIPGGQDWQGGINDRHAVLSRADAEV